MLHWLYLLYTLHFQVDVIPGAITSYTYVASLRGMLAIYKPDTQDCTVPERGLIKPQHSK